jgi:hypothetical protein
MNDKEQLGALWKTVIEDVRITPYFAYRVKRRFLPSQPRSCITVHPPLAGVLRPNSLLGVFLSRINPYSLGNHRLFLVT